MNIYGAPQGSHEVSSRRAHSSGAISPNPTVSVSSYNQTAPRCPSPAPAPLPSSTSYRTSPLGRTHRGLHLNCPKCIHAPNPNCSSLDVPFLSERHYHAPSCLNRKPGIALIPPSLTPHIQSVTGLWQFCLLNTFPSHQRYSE